MLWRDVWHHIASEYALIDLDGRVRRFARRYYAAVRRGFVRGRRFFLDERRLDRQWTDIRT